MIQFNLLPDIKLEYIRVKRLQRTVMAISIAVSVVAFILFVILLVNVQFVQKSHITNVTDDIKTANNDLKETEGLDQILTIQNQLNSLGDAHGKKPAANRVLGYIAQFTPPDARLESFNIDFMNQTATVTGSAVSLEAVNKFADSLKFTYYQLKEESTENKPLAFSLVTVKDFTKVDSAGKDPVQFTIEFKFDPLIFDNTKVVELTVPNLVTNPSILNRPVLSTPEVDEETE